MPALHRIMFGNKTPGILATMAQTLLFAEPRKTPSTYRTPPELLAKKETYFARMSFPRWQ